MCTMVFFHWGYGEWFSHWFFFVGVSVSNLPIDFLHWGYGERFAHWFFFIGVMVSDSPIHFFILVLVSDSPIDFFSFQIFFKHKIFFSLFLNYHKRTATYSFLAKTQTALERPILGRLSRSLPFWNSPGLPRWSKFIGEQNSHWANVKIAKFLFFQI